MTGVAAQDYLFPNLGGLLYEITNWRKASLLPEVIGLAWVVFYWWFHRTNWDWKREGLLVLVVSLLCSYYSFAYDEIIVLPALLAAAACGKPRVLLAGLILANLGYAVYLSGMVGRHPMFLWWTASAWFVIYMLSRPTQAVVYDDRGALASGAG
jgi:hypothetical protein